MNEVTPREAYDLMQNDSEYTYLDVRSEMEFAEGRARGAINIPIMNFVPGLGMTPNPAFAETITERIPKDAKLVVGCKSGVRSARACEILEQLGYTNLANIRGGFVGSFDQRGQVVEPGWSMLDLPVEK